MRIVGTKGYRTAKCSLRALQTYIREIEEWEEYKGLVKVVMRDGVRLDPPVWLDPWTKEEVRKGQ